MTNAGSEPQEILEILKTNSDSFSKHAKQSNTYWLSCVTIFVIYIVNIDIIIAGKQLKNIPFFGVNIDFETFLLVSGIFCSVINIPFCVSRISTFETFEINKYILNEINSKNTLIPIFNNLKICFGTKYQSNNLRRIYDLNYETYSRVYPFIDALRNSDFSKMSLFSRFSSDPSNYRLRYLTIYIPLFNCIPLIISLVLYLSYTYYYSGSAIYYLITSFALFCLISISLKSTSYLTNCVGKLTRPEVLKQKIDIFQNNGNVHKEIYAKIELSNLTGKENSFIYGNSYLFIFMLFLIIFAKLILLIPLLVQIDYSKLPPPVFM